MDPILAEHLGGIGGMKDAVQKMASSPEYKDLLASFKSMKRAIASPIVPIGNVHYARLETRTPMTLKGKSGVIVGTTLAVSRDGGKTWRFADRGVGKRDMIERLYPGAWEKLSLTDAHFAATP